MIASSRMVFGAERAYHRIMFRKLLRAMILLSVAFVSSAARAALTADNLLLIVNKNVPNSRMLAEHYSEQRHVPAGRIVELDLPTGDEISADAFDQSMVAPIRQFILSNHLEKQITCLVTFYGVPLRIPARANTPELRAELVSLRRQEREVAKQAEPLVAEIEKLAAEIDASFKPAAVGGMESSEGLSRRAEQAANFALNKVRAMPADQKRSEFEAKLKSIADRLRAPVKVSESDANSTSPPATRAALTPQEASAKLEELAVRRSDPADRRAFRDLLRDHGGILMFGQVLTAQELFLSPEESEAAVDNELPLLWWGLYPRGRWQPNVLNYKYADLHAKPTLMVMRLDAGGPNRVMEMIDTSIKVENEGLKGRVVLDSRGIPPQKPDGKSDLYGVYDQSIRNLEVLLHTHTKLTLLVDDRAALIPAGAVKDCSVYCGWYSPGKYVGSVAFVPGAVAFHIGSYEMLTLHNATEGWCRNLIDTGAVATLGPVSEPYLHSFPLAEEFFPVLLTGQLTLAETYWATNPLLSWRITMVGDPLYTPFKKNPAISSDVLPARMRGIFAGRTAAPSTAPSTAPSSRPTTVPHPE